MRSAIVALLVATVTPALAQAPEQIPDRAALEKRGDDLHAAGRAVERDAIDLARVAPAEANPIRRDAIELEHRGVIDRERAIDVDPSVYRLDDDVLKAAMRRR